MALPALLMSGASGCFWFAVGGAAEGGYVAGQDKSAGTTISDQWITTKIKSKIIADSKLKARNINVDTDKGVVTLHGTVFSAQEAERAAALAEGTKGVSRVISQLKITR